MDYLNILWIIPFVFSIHELEEWNILKWYKTYYRNLPASTNVSIRIHIVVLALTSFLLTGVALAFHGTFLFSAIVVFMSAFVLLNFLQHVIWTAQLKVYSPGLVTAVICLIAVAVVNIIFITNGRIDTPFYLLVLLIIPALMATLRVKGEMTKEVRSVHEFFIKVEKALRIVWPGNTRNSQDR